jgi:hypothetical protein
MWGNNIKMDSKGRNLEAVKAQDKYKRQAVMNTVMKLRVPRNVENFLIR